MPKLGLKSKIAIGLVLFLAAVVLGSYFFPTPQPGVHLAPNYGIESSSEEVHNGHETDSAHNGEEEAHHNPDPFYELGPILITNTLITAWMSIFVLAVFFILATRKMKLVPTGLQNIAEAILEVLINFVDGVAGPDHGRRFFPIIATIFLFVITNAWMGLLPFFNVIGWGEEGTSETLLSSMAGFPEFSGHIVETSLFRPANTDINVPLAIALVSFISVEYWGLTALGARHYLGKFFRYGQLISGIGQLIKGKVKSALTTLFYGCIDIFVGSLELVSEFVRIVSFTFRLFGNMTAGEVLLLMMTFLISWLIPVVFYGLETLLGAIQALIFAGLTLVFATLAVTPHEHEHEEEH